jgi:hypothetical protein
MFAHNLFFSTNITTWLSLLLGLVGFLLFSSKGFLKKIIGFIFFVFSIANYQSILQIAVLIVFFNTLLKLLQIQTTSEIKKLFFNALLQLFAAAAAYIVSFYINEFFLHKYHLHETHRLAQAEHGMDIDIILQRIFQAYTQGVDFLYFKLQLHYLYLTLAFISFILFFFALLQKKSSFLTKILAFCIFILAFLAIPPIINLPLLLGVEIPVRAYFPIGWALGGFIALIFTIAKSSLVRTFSSLIAIALIVVHIYYITIFFDAANRQTKADILRANTIVERIRNHPNYKKEPIAFYIAGTKHFYVQGWKMKYQDPFDSIWSRYKIFKYFTDLQFRKPTPHELKKLATYLINKGELIKPYPHKNSVIVYDGIAMLALSPDKINIQIEKRALLKKVPLLEKPIAQNKFQLYVKNNILFYYKKPCTKEDIKNKFFLRIFPKDPFHTYVGDRLINPYQTWDFYFGLYGAIENDTCKAAVKLPSYPIAKVYTGQFGNKKGLLWEENIKKPFQ